MERLKAEIKKLANQQIISNLIQIGIYTQVIDEYEQKLKNFKSEIALLELENEKIRKRYGNNQEQSKVS